jgi:hypothetical protein
LLWTMAFSMREFEQTTRNPVEFCFLLSSPDKSPNLV